MAKKYFQKNDTRCYSLAWHYEFIHEFDLDELELYEAKIEYSTEFFYCKLLDEVGEKNGTCNKRDCIQYSPNNKINGRCKYYGHLYEQTDKKKIIKKK